MHTQMFCRVVLKISKSALEFKPQFETQNWMPLVTNLNTVERSAGLSNEGKIVKVNCYRVHCIILSYSWHTGTRNLVSTSWFHVVRVMLVVYHPFAVVLSCFSDYRLIRRMNAQRP